MNSTRNKKRILVTGSAGQLGREIAALDAFTPELHFLFTSRDTLPVDDSESVKKYFKENRPQFCINCAAYTAVDKAEENEDLAFSINRDGAGYLAEAAALYDCRMIHISTDYVFDGNSNRPYKEDDRPSPINVYGKSKLAGEQRVLSIHPEATIIRTSWVYSPFGHNFVKTMMRLQKEKDLLNVVNDQYGCPTYAADLAELLVLMIREKNHPGIFHFTNQGVITWFDLAAEIKQLIASRCAILPVASSSYPTKAARPAYSALDSTLITSTYGFHLKNWEESLRRCVSKMI